MRVDRCVCFEVSFETLKAWADRHGGGFDALTARFGCGRACGLCIPSIRRMLETGRTSFDLLPPEQGSGVGGQGSGNPNAEQNDGESFSLTPDP